MAGKGIMSSLRGKMFEWQITLKEMKMVIIKYCRNSFSHGNLIQYTSFCPLSILKKSQLQNSQGYTDTNIFINNVSIKTSNR